MHDATQADLPDYFIIKVSPFRINRQDQINLPLARPVFDIFLSLNCARDVVMLFVIDKHFDAVFFCETVYKTFAMLERPSNEIVGDADIEGPAPTAS